MLQLLQLKHYGYVLVVRIADVLCLGSSRSSGNHALSLLQGRLSQWTMVLCELMNQLGDMKSITSRRRGFLFAMSQGFLFVLMICYCLKAHIGIMLGTLVFACLGVVPIVYHADGLWLTTTVSLYQQCYPTPSSSIPIPV